MIASKLARTKQMSSSLWKIIDEARSYIHELELRHREDQNSLNAALRELKQSAVREEKLLERVAEMEMRDAPALQQEEQTRVNMTLMRSMENMIQSAREETHNNNAVRSQILKVLQKTPSIQIHSTDDDVETSTNDISPAPTAAAFLAATSSLAASPTPPPTPPATIERAIGSRVEYTIQVCCGDGLGCGFNQDWIVTGFRTKDTDGSKSVVEEAGATIGDQLTGINNRNLLTDWPSRSSIIDYLRTAKQEGIVVRLTLRKKGRGTKIDEEKEEKEGESVVIVGGLDISSIPTTPWKDGQLFVSTPTGKWNR